MATSKEYTISRKVSDTEEEEVKVPSSSVSGLAVVATSGSYNDLADKPSIPDISGKANLNGGNTWTGNQQFNQGGYWFATDTNRPFVVERENGDALIAVNSNGVSFDSDGLGTMPFLLNGNAGTSGQVLTSKGANATPAWTDVSYDKITGTPDLSVYQTKTDDSLETNDKTVVGAINEVITGVSGMLESLGTSLAPQENGKLCKKVYVYPDGDLSQGTSYDASKDMYLSIGDGLTLEAIDKTNNIWNIKSASAITSVDGLGGGTISGTVRTTGSLTVDGSLTVGGKTAATTDQIPTKTSELTNDSGFTTNTGTITGITMNGASKGTSGVVDLGTVITSHQDISGKANLEGGNTFSGTQVINGFLDIRGSAADKHLKTRGIGGSDGNGTSADLYLQYASDYATKFGKTGNSSLNADGSITVGGNATIGGNLTVNGTTTTVNSTTLQVTDKLIEVAHGNTAKLTTPAGLVAPKYDGTNSGALVFDGDGTAYVGDVTLDSNGNISVADSNLQPLATRTGLVGGNLVQYDSTAQTLKDSGKKIGDLATTSAVNAKYTKPSGGIPKTDLASDVQTSLGKADTALQTHQDISGKANTADLATVATSGSYNDLSNKPTIPSNVVQYTTQTLTTAQKTQARSNIGAGTSSFSGSYDDLTNKPTIPSAVTSINGLSGGTLTSPITLTGGDSATASKMILDANGQITDTGTATLFGRSSGNLIVGSGSYPTTLRGKQTRPTYNGNDMALKSDVPDVSGKLDKTAYEENKTINFGDTGVLKIGKFKVYDTNVTCEITSTTSLTYNGKLVIACQNYIIMKMTVYGDAANTVAPNIFVKPSTTSDPYIEVYFKPPSWSKNVIHIYGSAIAEAPTDVCTNASAVPSTATEKPINALTYLAAGDGGYSLNASGYVKGSWLQAASLTNKGSNTGKVCVFDGAGWIYYRTPAEILSEAGGAKASDVPTVNDGKLTIQKNSIDVTTFTANQAGNVIANIQVPEALSDLTDDKGKGVIYNNSSAGTNSWALMGGGNTVGSSASANQCVAIGVGSNARYEKTIRIGTVVGLTPTTQSVTQIGIGSYTSTGRALYLGAGNTGFTYMNSAGSSWTSASDIRDKTDIEEIDHALDFIKKLKPITYVMNEREKYLVKDENDNPILDENGKQQYDVEAHKRGDKKKHRRFAGLSAQDTYQAMLDCYDNNSNYAQIVDNNKFDHPGDEYIEQYSMSYERLVPFLIKAMQEQQTQIDELKTTIKNLGGNVGTDLG